MTKLSRRPINPKDFGHYVNNLWSAFTLMDSKDQIRALFRDLFTHTEYKMFAKRLEVARRLLQGQTYDEISQSLKVTNHTIASINNILEREGTGLRIAHQKLKNVDMAKIKKEYLFPRYKKAPRISELVEAGISGTGALIRKASRKISAKKDL